MKIADKLRFSDQLFAICFFKEGPFVRVYNMSVYLAITQLDLDLKIHLVSYKKLPQQYVLKAGLPLNQLIKNYPQLIKYNWGYKLKGNWRVQSCDYDTWYQSTLKVQLSNSKNSPKQLTLLEAF